MIEFQLFRVKVFLPQQMSLLEPTRSRSDILREVIESKPEAQLRRGVQWHLGNVEQIGTDSLYFRVGRTTTSTLEFFEDGKFADQLFETAPYTHALIDLRTEVCVIAKKTQLSHQTSGIANQLARLFEHSETALRLETEFKIGEINDPEDFISQLKSAYLISKFTVWFTQPNPFDVNEDFIRPAQRLVRASNGQQGKTELKGQSLNAEVLEDISRSPISRIAFASIAEYCAHLSNGAYTVVLFDGALIQLSIDLNHQQIVGYRLCYYPCPFDIDSKDLASFPLLDLIQLHLKGRMDLLRLRSPPQAVNIEAITYKYNVANGLVRVTDGSEWHLDVSHL
jgi:hypothetical protein